jgi:dynein heavy chain
MSPPGSGRSEISSRFLRHLNILSIDPFDDETLRRIFTSEVDWHFKEDFDPAIVQLAIPLVEASLQLYKDVQVNKLIYFLE